MATTVNPAYEDAVVANLVAGTAVSSGQRWLALTTDTAGTTETTDYDGRIDITTLFATPSAGTAANTSDVGPYTFTLGDTIEGWAICDDETAAISTSYVMAGPLAGTQVVTSGGTLTVAIGDGEVTAVGA